MGEVLANSPVPVALLVDHGFVRAFRGREGTQKRVVAPLSGAASDTLVLNFAGQLLSDDAVSVEVVLLGAHAGTGSPWPHGSDKLRAKGSGRVQFRTSGAAASSRALRDCAAEADLVVLALAPVWGLDVERTSAESVRILAEFPASLIVLHAQPGRSWA